MAKCFHVTLGYPPKKHWELRPCKLTDREGNIIEEDYTCVCPRGKHTTVMREIPGDNEWWEKEGQWCPYCGEKRKLKFKRTYYRECSCGSRWYL